MTCKDVRQYLSPFLDNELTAKETLEIQEHLEECLACQQVYDLERGIRSLLKKGVTKEKAPPALWDRIVQRIKAPEPRNLKRLLWPVQARLSLAWAFAALLLLFLSIPLQSGITPDPVTFLTTQIVKDHVRTMTAGPALAVRSGDLQAVARWFKARTTIPVKVPRFEGPSPLLLGGTLCYVQDRQGVHLVFVQAGQPISLYALDALGRKLSGRPSLAIEGKEFYVRSVRGYRVVLWREGDLLCAVVGGEETSEEDLVHLALLFAKALQA